MATSGELRIASRKLREAGKLILEATYALNASGNKCECCGAFRRTKMREYQWWSSLKEVPRKLTSIADEMK